MQITEFIEVRRGNVAKHLEKLGLKEDILKSSSTEESKSKALRIRTRIQRAERDIATSMVEEMNLGDRVSRRLRGSDGQRPVFVLQALQSVGFPAISAVIKGASEVLERDGHIVLTANATASFEEELLHLVFGRKAVLTEVMTDELQVPCNWVMPTVELAPVSAKQLFDLIALLGGKVSGDFAMIREVMVRVLVDGGVSLNDKAARRSAFVFPGSNSVIMADPLQSAYLLICAAYAAGSRSMVGGEDTSAALRKGFRAALFSTMGGMLQPVDYCHTDGGLQLKRSSEFQSGVFGFGVFGIEALKDTNRVRTIEIVMDTFENILVKGQGEVFYNAESFGVLEGDHIHLASTDPGKLLKRIMMDLTQQCVLANGMDTSYATYRGAAGQGRMESCYWAPMLPSVFVGADGMLLRTDTPEEVIQSGKYALDLTHEFHDKCRGASAEEIKAALPAVGSPMPDVLHVPGKPVPLKVPRAYRGGTVTQVTTHESGFGNVEFFISVDRKVNDAEVKARGSVKGMFGHADVLVTQEDLTFSTMFQHDVTIQAKGNPKVILGASGAKMMGKASNRSFVSTVANALKTVLDYNEKTSFEGGYDHLITRFVEQCGKSQWITRTPTKAEFELLCEQYEVDMSKAVPFSEGLLKGMAYKFVIKSDKYLLGHKDEMMFVKLEDGRVGIAIKTMVFEYEDIIKVESSPVVTNATKVPSMLETAYSPWAMGFEHTATMISKGGMLHAKAYKELLVSMVTKQAPEGAVVISDTTESTESDKELMKLVIDKGIDELGKKDLFVVSSEGHTFVVNKRLLRTFAYGTEDSGLTRNVLELLGYAVEGNHDRVREMTRVILAQLKAIEKSPKVRKKLHQGAMAVGGKRVCWLTSKDEDINTVWINPFGEQATQLAKQFKCDVSELEGKMVFGYRAPMFLLVPLRIRFSVLVGPNCIAVHALIASVDQGDYDGDQYFLIPVTCPRAEAEMSAFDVVAYARKVAKATCAKSKLEHWQETNVWDSSKTEFAKAARILFSNLKKQMVASVKHQTVTMPTDGNRAHLAITQACLTRGLKSQRFDPILANGAMWFVFEPQLAGYSAAWAKASEILSEESPYSEKKNAFIQHAVTRLDLSVPMAEAWWDMAEGHRFYTKIDRSLASGNIDVNSPVFRTSCRPNPTPVEENAQLFALLSGAVKHLSQGKFSDLLMSLEKAIVTFNVVETRDGETVYTPILGPDGSHRTVQIRKVITALAKQGNPAAQRLEFFLTEILPLMPTKADDEETYE